MSFTAVHASWLLLADTKKQMNHGLSHKYRADPTAFLSASVTGPVLSLTQVF